MTSVLLIGAGLSTQSLVPYLKNLINTHDISLRVVDQDVRLAASRVGERSQIVLWCFGYKANRCP